jgi:hypothetical protein
MRTIDRPAKAEKSDVPDAADHAAVVEAWLAETGPLEPGQLVALFESALLALWRRAEITLGEVTLTAIVDRVLYTPAKTHPFLSALKLDKACSCFDGFRELGAQHADLADAVHLVLVEFLTVLGHLTDEILTPALHAELSKITPVGPGAMGVSDDGAQGPR